MNTRSRVLMFKGTDLIEINSALNWARGILARHAVAETAKLVGCAAIELHDRAHFPELHASIESLQCSALDLAWNEFDWKVERATEGGLRDPDVDFTSDLSLLQVGDTIAGVVFAEHPELFDMLADGHPYFRVATGEEIELTALAKGSAHRVHLVTANMYDRAILGDKVSRSADFDGRVRTVAYNLAISRGGIAGSPLDIVDGIARTRELAQELAPEVSDSLPREVSLERLSSPLCRVLSQEAEYSAMTP